MKIYVASSWRCATQPFVVAYLQNAGHDVYDFRNPPNRSGFGWPQVVSDGAKTPATYLQAIRHPIAIEGFASDMGALEEADAVVLVLPCNRSAHLELGYAVGKDKKTIVLLDDGPKFEPELMYLMVDHICEELDEVLQCLAIPPLRKRGEQP